jgi:DNA-binding GntR family transcriptional regulator
VDKYRIGAPLIELSPIPPVREAMPDRMYAVLKHRILTCIFEPGWKVNEKQLADEFGASRTPLREAMNRLALEGLLKLNPYKGFVVSYVTVEDISHLSEVRQIVEAETAALAARRATEDDCRRLDELCNLRYVPGNRRTYERYLLDNTAFHIAIARCARNYRLEQIVASVLDEMQRPLYLGLDVGIDADAATEEHTDLIKAIRAKKPAQAKKIMIDQLVRSQKRVLSALAAKLAKQ